MTRSFNAIIIGTGQRPSLAERKIAHNDGDDAATAREGIRILRLEV
jgi:hypothetical protein